MNTASCDATIAFITTDGVFLNSYRTTNYSYSVAAAILIDAGGNTIVTYSIVGELEVGGISARIPDVALYLISLWSI